MAASNKVFKHSVGLLAVGYGLGLLTAPKSGKQTRRRIKNATSSSVSDVEKELKKVYSLTKNNLNKFAENNPKLSDKLKAVNANALKSQTKVKEVLSAIHGEDNLDEDLNAILESAKKTLRELKSYLQK